MRVKLMRHGNCFDGFASAAVFTRFYREHVDPRASWINVGLRHGKPGPVDPALFDADVHAIVDFRYSADDRLDWWFDHHASGFPTPEDRAHFEERSNPKHFWDPTAPSCAGYMARSMSKTHGFDAGPLADLIRWADIIDAARFPDAQTAVAMQDPPVQLMAVCEHLKDGGLANQVIRSLADGDLHGIATDSQVQKRFRPIRDRHARTLDLMRKHIKVLDDVLFFDLTREKNIVGNKFGPYFLRPDATYVVVVNAFKDRTKISVGSNPWRLDARRHDISAICERYGGGGHPVVGGITLPGAGVEDTLRKANEIVTLLRGEGDGTCG